jgi:hypothetical protein
MKTRFQAFDFKCNLRRYIKVGLDYGEGRGGGAGGNGGVPLFPQEVLQAVVRGAVDQSVVGLYKLISVYPYSA